MIHEVQKSPKVQADFNGLFEGGTMLCLSHSDTAPDESGSPVQLRAGMMVTAFDMDEDPLGVRDDFIATGIVEPSPDWLQCQGSRWVLMIDAHGVRHESDLRCHT
ncbi:MAG: hypothetical protein QM796_09455 [Chthoniobacteraceae bacterium]